MSIVNLGNLHNEDVLFIVKAFLHIKGFTKKTRILQHNCKLLLF